MKLSIYVVEFVGFIFQPKIGQQKFPQVQCPLTSVDTTLLELIHLEAI